MRACIRFLKAAAVLCFLPAALFVLWWALSALKLVNAYLIPSPVKVFAAAAELLRSGELGRHLLVSLYRVWAGYAISTCLAFPAALLLHYSPRLKKLFHGILEFLRAVPPLAMIPLLILWLGIGEASKLAVIVLATFFPVFLNCLSGFDSMDSRWLELSKSLELSFFRHLRKVLIPAALPQIVTGFRLGFGYAWRALLGAELFAAASGLGYLITDAQEMARVDVVFVGILTIGLMGLVFDKLLRSVTDAVSAGREDRNWSVHE
ncbi:MAG: ABC transporter permease [Spirochaetales bacterium]|jgi:ABC-type nitrate/sulfonate/bicarbonate transport system permease component|nr:ABC transporter permease [Spirochaetales bacterium]